MVGGGFIMRMRYCVTQSTNKSSRNIISQVEKLARPSTDMVSISVQDLCLKLGVSRRTLERAFRNELHMSPGQYLMTLRLYSAWRDLVRGAGTVTSVATAYEFYELGRFSGRYKLLFGEYPSETLARAQAERSVGCETSPSAVIFKSPFDRLSMHKWVASGPSQAHHLQPRSGLASRR
jgi:AraC-like DNA-binding protein